MAPRTWRSCGAYGCLLITILLAGCDQPKDVGHRVYGYVDAQGKLVIAPAFQAVKPFHEGLAAVQGAAGWGFIDHEGRWIVPPQYLLAASFAEGRAAVRDSSGWWGYIDRSGLAVIAPQFVAAGPFMNGHAFVVGSDRQVKVIDVQGHVTRTAEDIKPNSMVTDLLGVADFSGDDLLDAMRKEALVPMSSRSAPADAAMGYVDLQGAWVVAPEFSEAGPFVEGRAWVRKGTQTGFIDPSGKVVVPLEYDDAWWRFSRNRTVAVRGDRVWLIDSAGARIADLGKWPWSDVESFLQLRLFQGFSDFFSDGLIPWARDGKWGYLGTEGTWVIEPRYDFAQPFYGGFATVRSGEQWLLIDARGNSVGEPWSGWTGPPQAGLTRIGSGTRWGFKGKDGRPPDHLPFATERFSFAGTVFADSRPLSLREGLAPVCQIAGHRWQVADSQGRTRAEGHFEALEPVGAGLYAFGVDQHWGLADGQLRVLAAPRLDDKPYFGRRAETFVTQDALNGCLNRRGQWTWFPLQPITYASCGGRIMAVTQAKDHVGVMGRDGRWRIPPDYQEIQQLGGSYFKVTRINAEGQSETRLADVTEQRVRYSIPNITGSCEPSHLCLVNVADRWRQLDRPSLRPMGPSFDEVRTSMEGDEGALVRQRNLWGYLSKSGRLTVAIEFDKIVIIRGRANTKTDEALVQRGQQWGAVSLGGRALVPVRFDELKPTGSGCFAARRGAKWGVVCADERESVSPRYDKVLFARTGLMYVVKEGRWTLVSADGRDVREAGAEWMQHILALSDHSTRFWSALTSDQHLYFVDKQTLATHQLVAPQGYAWGRPWDFGDWSFVDEEFGMTMPIHASNIAPQLDDRRDTKLIHFVLINQEGHLVTSQVFDDATESGACSSRCFTVSLHGKCGVIDIRGRWVVPLQHDHCETGYADGSRSLIIGDDEEPE